MDGPRVPRGALDGFGYNLTLLLGCTLPAMLLGMWGVLIANGHARGEWGDTAGLLFGYIVVSIPLAMIGALFLPVVMYLGGGWPRRARGIATGGVLLVMAALLATALPLGPRRSRDGWS